MHCMAVEELAYKRYLVSDEFVEETREFPF
jgi:hypothetical protein